MTRLIEGKDVVRNCLILKRFANLFNKLLIKYLPWSVSTPFGDPNMQINFFTKASAIVLVDIENSLEYIFECTFIFSQKNFWRIRL